MKQQFFVQGLQFIDEMSGDSRGKYSGKSLAELKAAYPGGDIEEAGAFTARKEAALITDPKEIDLEKFDYFLEVLPPKNFTVQPGLTYFQMIEHQSGRITQCCLAMQIKGKQRYFVFDDVDGLPAGKAVDKVRAWLDKTIKQRLEHLRGELRAERISLDELHELQSLAAHIAPDDVELREAAGVPEGQKPPPTTQPRAIKVAHKSN